MAYTTNDAIATVQEYLSLSQVGMHVIDGTKSRGIILQLPNGENAVIFVYPLVHKQDNTKTYFDTRDSGARERAVAWNYALANNIKFFCLGVNSQVEKYIDYLFSLECDEQTIERLSGTENGDRKPGVTGNQIIIPNDYKPLKPFDRIVNRLGTYIAVIHRNEIYQYLEKYDNRPYLLDKNIVAISENDEINDTLTGEVSVTKRWAQNRIIFGAPGTGKSYTLNGDRKELLGSNSETDYERVTFHPDYTYANFVGTYKPVMATRTKIDAETEETLAILINKGMTVQEKYDALYDKFNESNNLRKLPILLGLYCADVDSLNTRKENGDPDPSKAQFERSHGKFIKKYVNLLSDYDSSASIAYEYVPGPFMRTLVKAIKSMRSDNPKPVLLIIEEINRANVAAVFGEVFQLLDRDSNGDSEYPIQTSEDIRNYLASQLGGEPKDYSSIKIPRNMYIWATMNSADQGVFPMDTAFKRRWDFTYIGIDDSDDDIRGKYVKLGANQVQKVEWNKLRQAINTYLANQKINEDKQLGPYFIARKIVVPENGGNEIDSAMFTEVFKSKVIMYLFEDAAKQRRASLFAGCGVKANSYSSICKLFDEKGIAIFNDEIKNEAEATSATIDAGVEEAE